MPHCCRSVSNNSSMPQETHHAAKPKHQKEISSRFHPREARGNVCSVGERALPLPTRRAEVNYATKCPRSMPEGDQVRPFHVVDDLFSGQCASGPKRCASPQEAHLAGDPRSHDGLVGAENRHRRRGGALAGALAVALIAALLGAEAFGQEMWRGRGW